MALYKGNWRGLYIYIYPPISGVATLLITGDGAHLVELPPFDCIEILESAESLVVNWIPPSS